MKKLCATLILEGLLALALVLIVSCSKQPVVPPSAATQTPSPTATSPAGEPLTPIERAEAFITGDPGAILITEQDFRLAIAESAYFEVDDSIQARAIQMTTQANDPYALGVVGDVTPSDHPQPFSGTLFVVLRDPKITGDGKEVVSADYFVAAVELSGKASLIGTNVRFSTNSPETFGSGQPGNCCGKATICVPSQTPTCDDPSGYCAGPFVDVGLSGITPKPLQQRLDQGLPAVNLLVYPSKPPQASALAANPPGPQVLGACTQVRDRSCDVKLPVCFPGDPGYIETETGRPDPSSGSCGERPQPGGGRNVPKICTLIRTADGLPPECGGVCEFCGKPAISSFDGTPPYCKYARFGPDYEGPCWPKSEAQKQAENQAMWAKLGLEDGTLCEPTGKHGIKVCTTCTNGKCSEGYTPPDFSQYALESATATKDDSEYHSEVDSLDVVNPKPKPKKPPKADPPKDNPPQQPPAASAPQQSSTSTQQKEPEKPRTPLYPPPGTTPVPPPPPPAGSTPKPPREPDLDELFRDKPDRAADPVLIGDGSLHVQETDLSFEGPVRPLIFQRTYNSRSGRRSTLGSNWTHNWDVRIQPLTIDTTPVWALPYCAGSHTTTTCLFLHDGSSGGMQLFFYDQASQLFMPQAGNTDTVAAIKGGQEGWVLRRADGHQLYFNAQGYLVSDRDRFGNGFTISYERTPLFEMYDYYCSPTALAARNETRYSRRCAVLAYLLDDAIQPEPPPLGDAWLAPTAKQLDRDYPLPNNPTLRPQLAYARDYFVHLLKMGPGTESVFGSQRLRPIQVTDDLSRALTFSYTHAPLQASSPITAPTFDFASTPQAELLEAVSGPAGSLVRFSYARPVTYPAALNEMFLVGVGRTDTPAAGDVEPAANRHLRYQYQWPQGPASSYDGPPLLADNAAGYAASVFARFNDYYKTFVGCGYRLDEGGFCPGRFGLIEIAPGNPQFLARQREWAYISDVADNIILVDTSGVVAAETRYDADPDSPAFDRVTAQRYGSSSARQDAPPPDAPFDNWQTALPKATLAYVSAGPADTTAQTELTSAFLPPEIKGRYPLESAPPFTPTVPITRAFGVISSNGPACTFTGMNIARQKLPGYRDTMPYYDVSQPITGTEFAQPLRRTWLTCDQLAEAQLGDPTHNDLLSAQTPITVTLTPATTPGITRTLVLTYYVPSRIVGQRQFVAQNLNRICGWTKLVDRDGDMRYYGLNYRGQALVDAVRERSTGQYLYRERLYNADGLVIQERRPTRGASAWQPSNGWTSYAYDEIDPDGNRGWNGWLPVYWNRRMNLRRVETHAAGTQITLTIPVTLPSGGRSVFTTTVGAVSDDVDPVAGMTVTSTGRYQNFRYEPLFNQFWSAEEGSLEARSYPTGTMVVDVPQMRLDYVFDYQELALSPTATLTTSMQPVLDHLLPWGFNWILTGTKTVTGATVYSYDYPAIQSWQLPLAFYNRDLNGDGVQGFGYGPRDAHRARGVPIMAIRQDDSGVTAPLSQTLAAIYAPHGLPAVVIGPDNATTIFEYYSISSTRAITAAYGSNRPPSDQEVSIGYRGLLARVRTRQFASFYDEAYGPADPPCPKLAGPYQWLLPADCSSPQQELEALGLPSETVQAILSSTVISSTDRWQTAAFSYSEIGQARMAWDEGRATHVVRDTDGRVRQITDPISSTTATTYTLLGFPEHTIKVDAQGQVLQETYRRFDEEGRVRYTCDALVPGGCHPLGSRSPISGVVQLATYFPEGSVRTTTDPEGVVTEFQYDERQLLTLERSFHPAYPATRPRLTTYAYNIDGDMSAIYYRAQNPRLPFLSRIVLSETAAYDGLRRMTTHTDRRGYAWQTAYSNRDLVTRYRRDDTPYPRPARAKSAWEVVLQYDGLSRLEKRFDNGILTAHYKRTNGGNVFSVSAAGLGESFTTYDATAQPVWSRDAAGNQSIATRRAAAYVTSDTLVRTDGTGRQLTTATIARFDPLGLKIEETHYGSGDEQVWTWQRDGNGFILEETNPEGYVTRYERNLPGWPLSVFEQRTAGARPEYEVANFQYNRRGQLLRLIDPAQQTTDISYDPFGAVSTRSVPGQPRVVTMNIYDVLGRLESENRGAGLIKYIYDGRGDLVAELLLDRGTTFTMTERTYDDLGRVLKATEHNVAHGGFYVGDSTVANRLEYDELGRVTSDALQVGAAGPPYPVLSNWSTIAGNVWQRRLSYPLSRGSSEWLETFDNIGRLASKAQVLPATTAGRTTFQWLGELYAGRVQEQPGRSSPLRETRQFDHFGRPLGWQYSAIDLDETLLPIDPVEGDTYCGGAWNAKVCGRPLLEIAALRDVMGRIASLQWQFGQPRFANGALVRTDPPQPWRGYTYDPPGRLDRTWEDAGTAQSVDTVGLESHRVTAEDVERLGQQSAQWQYDRESFVGDLKAIRNVGSSASRWTRSASLGPGHQIQQLTLDGITRTLTYDAAGRIQTDGSHSYFYDPRGRLAGVAQNGALVEAYLYDASGRLAAVVSRGTNPMTTTFAYDGEQIVAAYDASGNPLWEAAWGPGLDQLVLWRELTSGAVDHLPLVDHRNSVVATWNPDAARLEQIAEYNPEGRLQLQDANDQVVCQEEGTGRICSHPAGMPFGFASAWRSPASGLIYMRNRWYSPELGQFMSHDLLRYRDSYNAYAYVGLDPINRIDPHGLTGSELADEWGRYHRESSKILEDWVAEGSRTGWEKYVGVTYNVMLPYGVLVEDTNMWKVQISTFLQTAMDLGEGMVDVLRIGEGVAQGGWKGYGRDALRAASVIPAVGRLGSVSRWLGGLRLRPFGNQRLFFNRSFVEGITRFIHGAKQTYWQLGGGAGVDALGRPLRNLHHVWWPDRWRLRWVENTIRRLGGNPAAERFAEGLRSFKEGGWNLLELPREWNQWLGVFGRYARGIPRAQQPALRETREGLLRIGLIGGAVAEYFGVKSFVTRLREDPPQQNSSVPCEQKFCMAR